ncbi:hypothetical protein AB0J38_14205 [Streptomyces sp. NPDC050095]|uniref:hypothetical protein n=1 Tax=unclassified Streptomyces TaxID=2593676 RepID=UPI003441CDD9
MPLMTSYRRVSAVAVAALLVSGFAAPAAFAATPEHAPAATSVAPSPDTPLVGAGLSLDLNAALGLDAHGIVTAAVKGAVDVDGAIQLKVGKGSTIVHKNHRVTGGTVNLVGGIQLSHGGKKVVVSGLKVNLGSGAITANVEAGAKVRAVVLGSINVRTATAAIAEGSSVATLNLANDGIKLNAAALVDLGTDIGACVDVDVDAGATVDVDAALDVDANLAIGTRLDADLIVALGLDADIDLDLGLSGLLDLDLFADISIL